MFFLKVQTPRLMGRVVTINDSNSEKALSGVSVSVVDLVLRHRICAQQLAVLFFSIK